MSVDLFLFVDKAPIVVVRGFCFFLAMKTLSFIQVVNVPSVFVCVRDRSVRFLNVRLVKLDTKERL